MFVQGWMVIGWWKARPPARVLVAVLEGCKISELHSAIRSGSDKTLSEKDLFGFFALLCIWEHRFIAWVVYRLVIQCAKFRWGLIVSNLWILVELRFRKVVRSSCNFFHFRFCTTLSVIKMNLCTTSISLQISVTYVHIYICASKLPRIFRYFPWIWKYEGVQCINP